MHEVGGWRVNCSAFVLIRGGQPIRLFERAKIRASAGRAPRSRYVIEISRGLGDLKSLDLGRAGSIPAARTMNGRS